MLRDLAGQPAFLLAVALAGALVALLLARWLRAARGSLRAVRRARRAGIGEEAAARLLTRAGFTIVARQARMWWTPTLDGEPIETELRADYLVEDADHTLLVAEVKTGEEAPQLSTAATRRQLLEYQVAFKLAFGADGVLLVCPELGAIHRVQFPLPPALAPSTAPALSTRAPTTATSARRTARARD